MLIFCIGGVDLPQNIQVNKQFIIMLRWNSVKICWILFIKNILAVACCLLKSVDIDAKTITITNNESILSS